jgi:hypothetical protein
VVCIEEVQFLYLLGADEDLALGLLDGGGVCLHVGLLDAKEGGEVNVQVGLVEGEDVCLHVGLLDAEEGREVCLQVGTNVPGRERVGK